MDHGTRHPNLVIMKLAGYYKSKGNYVELIYDDYKRVKDFEKVFIAKVFNFTYVPEWVLGEKNVKYGGTGFFEDGGKGLQKEIEHYMPDYSIYDKFIEEASKKSKDAHRFDDYKYYSIGFTTRGCFRKCAFCVNKKYDCVKLHSPVEEFLDLKRPRIYLWDDNILAYPGWEQVLNALEVTQKPFQFRQGIDLRLMTDKKAYRFNKTKWHGDFIFAFDHVEDAKLITERIQLWKKYTSKQPKLYVLVAFDSQDEHDVENAFKRIAILMKYGCLPYIMRYEKYKTSKFKGMYTQIARWCNQPQFYKKMTFREFCERNQFYHPNKNTYCASYKVMLEFEKKFPKIAKKYFDLRFESENYYKINYGYGKKYCNKQSCYRCKFNNKSWHDILKGDISNFINTYYNREVNQNCLQYGNAECHYKNMHLFGKELANKILNVSIDDIKVAVLADSTYWINVYPRDFGLIPDGKNFVLGLKFLKKIKANDVRTVKSKSRTAKTINLIKILSMMDLLNYYPNKDHRVELTALGEVFLELKPLQQEDIWKKNAYLVEGVRNQIKPF